MMERKNLYIKNLLNILIVLFLGDTHFFSKNIYSTYFMVIMMLIISAFLFLRTKKYKFSKYCKIIILSELLVLFFSFLNNRLNFYYQKMWVSSLLLTIWCDQEMQKDFKNLIFSLKTGCYLLLYIDLIHLNLNDLSGTLHIMSLAGHKNYHSYVLLFTMGFDSMYNALNNKKRITVIQVITLLFFLYSIKIYNSASALIGIVIFIGLLFLLPIIKNSKKILRLFYIIYMAAEILIILVGNVDFIKNILFTLNRDVTFSGRSYMWNNAWQLFISNIFIGHGFLAEVATYHGIYQYNNCHNYILNLLISGGIFYFLMYVFIYHNILKEVTTKKVGYVKYPYITLLISILVMGFTEVIVIANSLFLPLLLIGCCMGNSSRGDINEQN